MGYARSPTAGGAARLAEVVSDRESLEDRLGITGDVHTIAAVVAALSTRPPLSVALLGDWGIGKSSFMRQVQDRVDVLASQSKTGGECVRGERAAGAVQRVALQRRSPVGWVG